MAGIRSQPIPVRSLVRHTVGRMVGEVFHEPPRVSAETLAVLTHRLKERFETLQPYDLTDALPSERVWRQNMNRLLDLVRAQDAVRFLEWDVVNQQMFVSNAGYIGDELRYLRSLPSWSTRWRPALRESSLGAPTPLWKFPRSSGNLVHHSYHLARFEEATGMGVDQLATIVEFGGGYGSLCRLAHRLGFGGRYVLFDLPPFAELQRFYLSGLGLPAVDHGGHGDGRAGIVCLSDVNELETVLTGISNMERSMFVATWSLSETPVALRERVLARIEHFGYFLFAYGREFGEVDNVRFFEDWSRGHSEIRWSREAIVHMRGQSFYLFGSRATE